MPKQPSQTETSLSPRTQAFTDRMKPRPEQVVNPDAQRQQEQAIWHVQQ